MNAEPEPPYSVHPASFRVQKLSRRDWLVIAACLLLAAMSIGVVARFFTTAFPEAAIDFRFDRETSRGIAERLVKVQNIDVAEMKHAARFDSDDTARVFLERSLGLENATKVLRGDVRVFYWRHRWFRPLQEEELSVDVAPTGEIVAFQHKIPEDRAIADRGTMPPVAFLRSLGVRVDDLRLVSMSERRLPRRMQRIFTFESRSMRPAGAPYRHTVTVDGNRITSYSQAVKVPETWIRSYREMRSKNNAAGEVDLLFNGALLLGAVVVFVMRLRRGDLHLKFLLFVGGAAILLVGGTALNSLPAQLAYYDTTMSYPNFLGRVILDAAIQSFGMAMLLIVMCGAGEVLYRERLPKQLAIPRLWTRKSLTSKRVFLAMIVGYALVPLFIAYQVVFYLTARRFGAWAPAEVPYDDLLNSALPWVAVLFAGFFPAFSEEFLSRAFAIPWLQRFVRSRFAAILLAGFIWGFGHSAYPQQPFYIRGLEVGLVGIVAGLLMDRVGLLPLLVWHYTIDAVYTATLLFNSGNAYYIASAALASLIFTIPMLAAIALYIRNKGFLPDDELLNETLPVEPPPERPEVRVAVAEFPAPIAVTRKRVLLAMAAIAIAAIAFGFRPPSPDDAIDYRIDKQRAKEIARAHVGRIDARYVIAAPVEGFRSWDEESSREEGGAPGGFDATAATYLVQNGVRDLAEVFRTRLQAGTWTVRFFTPMQKEETFVEVDPRTERVIGYHQYQDERAPGATLPQAAALMLAVRAFPIYGAEAARYELKEALSFQQPARRDWLFHFEERTPIAARAFKRVSVRVAGDRVTQFNAHVKIPDSVYREAAEETFANIVLVALKIVGMVALLAFVVTGLILASRAHGLAWRRALKWTLPLAIIPIVSIASQHELALFGYNTSVAWETFRVRLGTTIVRNAGVQIGILFLALAGLEAAKPYALSLATREGRARFGRAAALAAITAIALFAITDVALSWLDHALPSAAAVSLAVSDDVATPFPALVGAAQALFGAIAIAAAVALFTVAVRRHAALITCAALFCAMVDPNATAAQMPRMLVEAAVTTAIVWIVARYVLGGNPLAWPLAVFVAVALQSGAGLLVHDRPDLIGNGIALLAIAVAALLWAASGGQARLPVQRNADGEGQAGLPVLHQ